MALCQDPTLTYLNELGYNVVRLPREGIEPLDVLGREAGSIERLGDLGQIWSSDHPAPPRSPPQAAAGLDGRRSARLKLSIGLKLLERILAGMGASVGLSAAYSRARELEFTLTGVRTSRVDPFELGRYLAAGDVDLSNPVVARYFTSDDAEAFVITEVLKSDAITVSTVGSGGQEVSLDVPVIQELVGAEIRAEAAAESAGSITYQGPALLTFGFKLFGIAYAAGAWRIHGRPPAADYAFHVAADAGEGVLLSNVGTVVVPEHAMR